MQVIVGFDGSPAARKALAWAVEEAPRYDARLVVWTVLPQKPELYADRAQLLADLRRSVTEIADGAEVDFRSGHGAAAAVLTEACAEDDILVVGTRGGAPLTGMLLGSVSRACLYHAPCTVTVVPAEAEPAPSRSRVIAAVDGSEPSRRALRRAAQEAELRGAELQAVHAVYWDRLGTELLVPTPEELREWGEHLLADELAKTGIKAHPLVLPGRPGEVLVRAAAAADLLVVGPRGHNPLTGLLLGSTSEYCARHATCPVMIVR